MKPAIWTHAKWGDLQFIGTYSKRSKSKRLLKLSWKQTHTSFRMEFTYSGWQAAQKAGWVNLG